jgi:uncharacterized protein
MERAMLEGYPALNRITNDLDKLLRTSHPSFFGEKASHPYSSIKRYKVIHDNLWGTSRFTWREMILIDCPVMQRLRDIHQTGLAHHVYPSARHSRFEHSLGVLTIASRIFDSLQQRYPGEMREIAMQVSGKTDLIEITAFVGQMRQELRLAALLHDTGHSLHSHASEQVYSNIPLLQEASEELSTFVGKEKGAGEVLSFCLARTPCLMELLKRAEQKLIPTQGADEENGEISMNNVSLLIVGRSQHPYLQFLGDIISSGFDADKLDYLLRDAIAAGLPLRYDLERYLFTVYPDHDVLPDEEFQLEKLYAAVGATVHRKAPQEGVSQFHHYETYRLRLPKLAMSTIEQIIICKLMLFSYIYHHSKVRAAETLLVHLLRMKFGLWRAAGENDEALLRRFLTMSDASLEGAEFRLSTNELVAEYSYRILNRLLPRQVYRLSAAATNDRNGALLKNFFTKIEDRAQRADNIRRLENAIGVRLLEQRNDIGKSPEEALRIAGVWVDVPKVPKFEDISVIVGKSKGSPGARIADVFPISQWTEAYENHRFYVRVYAFSEYFEVARTAARGAIEAVIGISSETFFDVATKDRST